MCLLIRIHEMRYEPKHLILALIAVSSNEGLDKPAKMSGLPQGLCCLHTQSIDIVADPY